MEHLGTLQSENFANSSFSLRSLEFTFLKVRVQLERKSSKNWTQEDLMLQLNGKISTGLRANLVSCPVSGGISREIT